MLEGPRRLSESVLWRAQDRYYEDSAQRAWSSGEVPHTLTTGPMLARAYARLIESFAADCRRGALGPVDPTEPLVVLELGSGTGRLAFELLRAIDRSAIAPFRICVVATDKVEENVAAIAGHEALRPYREAGELEAARFVAGAGEELDLGGDRRLAPGSLANPLVVIANYLFDVIPQDLFSVEGGELHEELVATFAEDPVGPGEADFFRRIYLATKASEVPPDRYGGGIVDALLAAVATGRAEGRFLYPAHGVRALAELLGVASGRMLALLGERPGAVPARTPTSVAVASAIAADPAVRQGPAVLETHLGEAHRPGALLQMGVHGGSMSLPVDLSIFAALGEPLVLLPEAPPSALIVAALCWGAGIRPDALRRAYRRHVADVGPEDLYLLVKGAFERPGSIRPPEHLAVLRSGGYDPYLLRLSYESFASLEGRLPDKDLLELERVLGEIAAHDFVIDDTDVAFGIGALLAPLGAIESARSYFLASIARFGPSAVREHHVALCEVHLGRIDEARERLSRALSLDTDYAPARELLEEIAARLGG
jgi:tetratricopeptide (TPR) repeat protein